MAKEEPQVFYGRRRRPSLLWDKTCRYFMVFYEKRHQVLRGRRRPPGILWKKNTSRKKVFFGRKVFCRRKRRTSGLLRKKKKNTPRSSVKEENPRKYACIPWKKKKKTYRRRHSSLQWKKIYKSSMEEDLQDFMGEDLEVFFCGRRRRPLGIRYMTSSLVLQKTSWCYM